jgi:geranylgeranyl pyrophosphate synthase
VLAEHFARGKMLRPLLAFAAAAAVGGDPATALPAAEAIELLHGASLVHDDIIDQAATRRGLPALHRRVGAGVALVLGDYLLVRAFAVLGAAQPSHPPERVLEALGRLGRHAQQCCRGQVQELLAPGRQDSEGLYLAIVRGKTAAPFAAAAGLGAVLGGGAAWEVAALEGYGRDVGIAFQIHDDLLDFTGDEEALGKPVGQSLAEGPPTLPLIYLRRYGSRAAREEYKRMCRAGPERQGLAALLEREGIFQRVRATRQRYVLAAQRALDGLRPSGAVTLLRRFPLDAVTQEEDKVSPLVPAWSGGGADRRTRSCGRRRRSARMPGADAGGLRAGARRTEGDAGSAGKQINVTMP